MLCTVYIKTLFKRIRNPLCKYWVFAVKQVFNLWTIALKTNILAVHDIVDFHVIAYVFGFTFFQNVAVKYAFTIHGIENKVASFDGILHLSCVILGK